MQIERRNSVDAPLCGKVLMVSFMFTTISYWWKAPNEINGVIGLSDNCSESGGTSVDNISYSSLNHLASTMYQYDFLYWRFYQHFVIDTGVRNGKWCHSMKYNSCEVNTADTMTIYLFTVLPEVGRKSLFRRKFFFKRLCYLIF